MPETWTNGPSRLALADARSLPLEDATVDCVCSSPPYWMLRKYQDQDARTLGSEPTVDEYLANLLAVFREVRRVLKPTGSVWVNIGDTRGELNRLGIPERFALAMQADGWTWRDTICWIKPSPMPESVSGWAWQPCRVKVKSQSRARIAGHYALSGNETIRPGSGGVTGKIPDAFQTQWQPCPGCAKCQDTDGLVLRRGNWRPTNAFEYVYLFTLGDGAYFDPEAVRTASPYHIQQGSIYTADSGHTNGVGSRTLHQYNPAGANLRNVWNDIKPEPSGDMVCPECQRVFKRRVYQRFKKLDSRPACPRCQEPLAAHYAAFPTGLPERCIRASTPERGCCARCGVPWARVVEQSRPQNYPGQGEHLGDSGNGMKMGEKWNTETRTLGWRACCGCGTPETVPALVLDMFVGSGSTSVAAQRLGRRSLGTDLSETYLAMAAERLAAEPVPLVAG